MPQECLSRSAGPVCPPFIGICPSVDLRAVSGLCLQYLLLGCCPSYNVVMDKTCKCPFSKVYFLQRYLLVLGVLLFIAALFSYSDADELLGDLDEGSCLMVSKGPDGHLNDIKLSEPCRMYSVVFEKDYWDLLRTAQSCRYGRPLRPLLEDVN